MQFFRRFGTVTDSQTLTTNPSRRLVWRIGMRAGLAVSLLGAALGGAFVATELQPAPHAAAAHQQPAPVVQKRVIVPVAPQPPVLQRPAATATATAVPIPTPAPPVRAMLIADGGHASPFGAWLQSREVTLRITLSAGHSPSMLRAEAEIAPADSPFTGVPNARSGEVAVPAGADAQAPIAVADLPGGRRYHWRVRARANDGTVSPWAGGGVFGVSVAAPMPPVLAATNVRIGGWSRDSHALFRWNPAISQAPIAFYEYAITPTGARVSPSAWERVNGSVLTLAKVAEGRWQVRVRAVDLAGNRSRAVVWGFALAHSAPSAPHIVTAMPAPGAWSNADAPTLSWAVDASAAPIVAYQYAAIPDATGGASPISWTTTLSPSLTLPGLTDGDWRVLVRAIDAVGSTSPELRWIFHIDREHPLLTAPALSLDSFTPPVQKLHLKVGLGKRADISFDIYAVGKTTPLRTVDLGVHDPGPVKDLVWDGALAPKKLAPGGAYTLVVTATDRAGNQSQVASAPVTVLVKRIFISISKEKLWAYEGAKQVYFTLVTNGGPDTPTLPGIFHVEGKYNGMIFHSPWPKGSPLWYPDSPTSYSLLYNANGGYFLHDAPWRSNFGPGSNSLAGTPGGSYTGTHGCTNVPLDMMGQIFTWADVGTLIQIVP